MRRKVILLTALTGFVGQARADMAPFRTFGSKRSYPVQISEADSTTGRGYGINALSCFTDPQGLDIRLERVAAGKGEGAIEIRGIVRNYSHKKLETPLHLRVSGVKGEDEKSFLLAPELPALGSRTFLVNYYGSKPELKLLLTYKPAKSCAPLSLTLPKG